MDDMSKYINIFIDETRENLQNLNICLLELEANPEDIKLLNDIFRFAHTIKGMSGTMGYNRIFNLINEIENILHLARDQKIKIDSKIADVIFRGIDILETYTDNISKSGGEGERQDIDLVEKLRQFSKTNMQTNNNYTDDNYAKLKSDSVPTHNNKINIVELKKEDTSSLTKVNLVSRERTEYPYVRVETQSLSTLMNLVGDLLITKTKFEASNNIERNNNYIEAMESLEKVVTNLNDVVLEMRMVSVETIFNRFPRLVRDLSKELGKEVSLKTIGLNTKLDKTIIDEVGELLVHLIKNSLDHGIEIPEKRVSLGKPQKGNLYLRAYRKGSHVVIEVEDDGAGIDVKKIRQKAIEKRLIDKGTGFNGIDEDTILNLIFSPNFSVLDHANHISGRGVGLDAVKTKIESIGGTVGIENNYPNGTKFIIRIPLTLAIIPVLLVMAGGEKYAIPFNVIEYVVNVDEKGIFKINEKEFVSIRDLVMPLLRLNEILETGLIKTTQNRWKAIVVEKEGELVALLVDLLLGKQDIIIKPISKTLMSTDLVSGATILEDGRVALVLDINLF